MSLSPQRTALAFGLLIALGVLGVYAAVAGHGFVSYDDPVYLLENHTVQRGFTLEGIRWAFTTGYAANWHPLTWLSHMLDVELFGMEPRGHHVMGVLLHGLNALLACLALRNLTGRTWVAVTVAALFALHPQRVESVAWASERKDLLAGTFFFLTLLAYGRWARRGGLGNYLLVAGAYALGLLAKPMLVTVPFLLAVLDVWPLGRVGRRPATSPAHPGLTVRAVGGRGWILEKVPLLLLSVASAATTFVVQRASGATSSLDNFPLHLRLLNALASYARYLEKTLLPKDLAVFYPHPGLVADEPVRALLVPALAGGLLLVAFGAAAWRWRRERPWIFAAGAWYLGMLVPVIGIVQVGSQAMADRYSYLPVVGFLLGCVMALDELCERRPSLRRPLTAVLLVWTLGLSFLTWRQVPVWKDSETLFTHAIGATERNYIAYCSLGFARLEAGDPQEAERLLLRAEEFHDLDVVVQNNLAYLYLTLGDARRARPHLEKALRLAPSRRVLYNLGRLGLLEGNLEAAIDGFERALEKDPDMVDALVNLGFAQLQRGAPEAARPRFERALALRSDSAGAHLGLGAIALGARDFGRARDHFAAAIELDPDYADAHHNLGLALDGLGDSVGAEAARARARALR